MPIDGIKKIVNKRPAKKHFVVKPKAGKMDAITRPQAKQVVRLKKHKAPSFYIVPAKAKAKKTSRFALAKRLYINKKVPILGVIILLALAFTGGMWSVLGASQSSADNQGQVLAAYDTEPAGSIIIPEVSITAGNSTSTAEIFNTPIQYLKNYLASTTEPDIIEHRTKAIKQFLDERHSPLAAASETIAQQPHWQLILAIAFAESTLGKNCSDYNCSNIGVGPSSPYWHKYASYQDWVLDFNRLLDKKYNNWTLGQMCGVYVKPCNPNWLAATSQLLTALNDENIE